jgi:predicted dehydrogenase
MTKKIKVAVIGYGHLGRWHAEKASAHKAAELVAIVENSEEGRKRALEIYSSDIIFPDIKDVIDIIDAAFVVVPTSFHFEIVKKLIKADKHIFCEKPLAASLEHANELIELIKEKPDLKIQVGHSERFHEVWNQKSQFEKYFNNQSTIRITRVAPFKGRATDVDVVQDLMIHDLDLLVFLINEIPVSVSSSGHKIRTKYWDSVTSRLEFKSGICAYITVGRNHVKEVREVEFTNLNGTVCFDLFANEVLVSDKKSEAVEKISYNKRDHLLFEHDSFYSSITEDTKPIVSIEDGVLAVKLIDAVIKSLETNQIQQIEI